MNMKLKGVGEKWKKLRKKKIFWVMLIVVILLIAGTVMFVIAKKKAAAKQNVTTVQEVEATTGDVTNSIASTGTVANGSATDVSIPVGVKVTEVLVSSGDSVTTGQELAKVDQASVATVLLTVRQNIESVDDAIDNLSSDANDSTTEEYLEKIVLENTLAELTKQKELLTTMLSSGNIVSTSDGIISSVIASNGAEIAAGNTSTSSTSSSSGSSSSGTSGSSSSSDSGTTGMTSTTEYTASFLSTGTVATESVATVSSEGISTQTVAEDIIEDDLKALTITQPVTGASPQTKLTTGTDKFTGSISWDCAGTYQAETRYTATITLKAASGYTFQDGDQYGITITGATLSSDSPKVYQTAGVEGNQLIIKATFEKTTAQETDMKDDTSEQNTDTGNGLLGGTATGSNATGGYDNGTAGAGLSGSASDTTSSDSSTALNSKYAVENGTPFTVASGNDVVISVSVSELDINSISNGQTATVTLDALDGQEYEGTVTSISSVASTSNGSSTYPVQITLGKQEGMKVGMSASTTINIEESKDVITIPVLALQESQGSSFVYTKKDSDGNLSGEVEVETGLSNGTTVEITSGLSEGDTVYYLKTESESDDFGFQMEGGMAGEMPSGDFGEMKPDMGGGTKPSVGGRSDG